MQKYLLGTAPWASTLLGDLEKMSHKAGPSTRKTHHVLLRRPVEGSDNAPPRWSVHRSL